MMTRSLLPTTALLLSLLALIMPWPAATELMGSLPVEQHKPEAGEIHVRSRRLDSTFSGRLKRVKLSDRNLDPKYKTFMRLAIILEMDIQMIEPSDESLILGGIVVSLVDEKLRRLRLSTDGKNVHVYRVDVRDPKDPDSIANVLKRNGSIFSVTLYRPSTGITVVAEPIPGKKGKYGTFSTDDWDQLRMSKFVSDRVFRSDYRNNIFDDEDRLKIDVSGGGRRGLRRNLQSDGTCSEYRVLRMDIRFDSDFCRAHGGRQSAIDRVYSILAVANAPYNRYPLCMKIEACRVDGYCREEDARPKDPYRTMVDESTLLCRSVSRNSVLDKFQEFVYGDDDYEPEGECDTAQLLFGGNFEVPQGAFISTGCGSIGALCNEVAAAVSHVGLHTQNLAAQAAVVAHELGHNANSDHDLEDGHVMYGLNCIGCDKFSPASIRNMTAYVDKVESDECLGFERGSSALAEDRCQDTYTKKIPCNKKSDRLCTWRPDIDKCWERADMKCEDYVSDKQCLWHGSNCVWTDFKCRSTCEDASGKSACDNSGVCTWREDTKTCRAQHKMKCNAFDDAFRCREHGTYCEWDGRKNECADMTEAPPKGVDKCGVIDSTVYCHRDRFKLCSWDFTERKCRRRDDMKCSEFTREKFCLRHTSRKCTWNTKDKQCEPK